LNVVYYPRLLEFFRAANEAALLSRVNMEATILVFQSCISPLAYSCCRISADSGANKSSNHGTGSLVAEGHHRCFDWFSTRLEGVFLDASRVSSSFRLSLLWILIRNYVLFIVDVLEANSRTSTC